MDNYVYNLQIMHLIYETLYFGRIEITMQKEELNELLTKAKELLKNEVTKISYETWIRDLDIDSAENGNIVLVANNAFQKESIISRYHDLFRNTFNYITNKNCEISVILKDDVTEDKNVVLNQPNTNSSYPNSTYLIHLLLEITIDLLMPLL